MRVLGSTCIQLVFVVLLLVLILPLVERAPFSLGNAFRYQHIISIFSTRRYESHWGTTNSGGFWGDIGVKSSADANWEKTDMGWPIVPWGFRKLLLWIQARYRCADAIFGVIRSRDCSVIYQLFDKVDSPAPSSRFC